MKLAIVVNVFDGEELLEGALLCVRNFAHQIIAVWQTRSNNGEKYLGGKREILRLKKKGLVDIDIEFFPNLEKTARANELRKRQIGLDIAREHNTHFLSMDTDEYYEREQFARAVGIAKNYDSTFCHLYTYYKEPIYQLTPPETYLVPFIHKITDKTSLGEKHCYHVDPTRAVSPLGVHYVFSFEEIAMHHFSFVRKDIGRKLRNSSAKNDDVRDIEQLVSQFKNFDPEKRNMIVCAGHGTILVENRFGISSFENFC